MKKMSRVFPSRKVGVLAFPVEETARTKVWRYGDSEGARQSPHYFPKASFRTQMSLYLSNTYYHIPSILRFHCFQTAFSRVGKKAPSLYIDTLIARSVLLSEMLKYRGVKSVFKIEEMLCGAGPRSEDTGCSMCVPWPCAPPLLGPASPRKGLVCARWHQPHIPGTNSRIRCCSKVLEKKALNTLLTFT